MGVWRRVLARRFTLSLTLYLKWGGDSFGVRRLRLRGTQQRRLCGRRCVSCLARESGAAAGAAATCDSPEIDVPVCVPDIDVDADAGRGAAQTYLHAAHILARFELEVADIGRIDAANEIVVFLLLLSDCLRRSRWRRRFAGLADVKKWHPVVS